MAVNELPRPPAATVADLMEALSGFDPDDLVFVVAGDRLRPIFLDKCRIQWERWGTDHVEWDVAEPEDADAPGGVVVGWDGQIKIG